MRARKHFCASLPHSRVSGSGLHRCPRYGARSAWAQPVAKHHFLVSSQLDPAPNLAYLLPHFPYLPCTPTPASYCNNHCSSRFRHGHQRLALDVLRHHSWLGSHHTRAQFRLLRGRSVLLSHVCALRFGPLPVFEICIWCGSSVCDCDGRRMLSP